MLNCYLNGQAITQGKAFRMALAASQRECCFDDVAAWIKRAVEDEEAREMIMGMVSGLEVYAA